MKKLPEGHKLLPPGVEVYRGNRRYRYSCPIDIYPDKYSDVPGIKEEVKSPDLNSEKFTKKQEGKGKEK